MNLGERIAEQRNKQGYSQVELGNCLNVDFITVASWEAGVNIPNIDTLIKISEVLGVSTDYLLKGQEITLDSVVACDDDNTLRPEKRVLFNSELAVSGKHVGTKQKSTKRRATLVILVCAGFIV